MVIVLYVNKSAHVNQVLSTGLGRIVPNLISRKHTNSAATGVYYSFSGNSILKVSTMTFMF